MGGMLACERRSASAGGLPPVWHASVPGLDVDGGPSTHIDINDLRFERWIGEGTFAHVWLATHASAGHKFAVKQIPKQRMVQKGLVDRMVAIRTCLDMIASPFVVPLVHFCHDSSNLYFVHKFVPGAELLVVLRRARRFDKATVRFFVLQVTAALVYLHSRRIIHRQATPENIMIGTDGYLQLSGFGFSKVLDGQTNGRTYSLVGIPEYMAPEILLEKGHDHMVDWWILGILAFEMRVGFPPFADNDPNLIYDMILAGKVYMPSHLDDPFKQLVLGLVSGNLMRRRRCVSSSPFFTGVDWAALTSKRLPVSIFPPAECEQASEGANAPALAPSLAADDDPFRARWPILSGERQAAPAEHAASTVRVVSGGPGP